MTIGSQKSLTYTERQMIVHARLCATAARQDLGSKAADGEKARPTVASLNRTMERLASIEKLLEQVLAPMSASTLPPIPHASTNEKLIVGKLVTDLLAAGHMLTVYDGGEDVVVLSNDADAIFKALSSTDRDVIRVTPRGWVLLVWGNDVDVISDYTMSLEPLLAGANALAEELS